VEAKQLKQLPWEDERSHQQEKSESRSVRDELGIHNFALEQKYV